MTRVEIVRLMDDVCSLANCTTLRGEEAERVRRDVANRTILLCQEALARTVHIRINQGDYEKLARYMPCRVTAQEGVTVDVALGTVNLNTR